MRKVLDSLRCLLIDIDLIIGHFPAFIHYLGLRGWHVDTDIDPAICHESALEDLDFPGEDLDRHLNEKLEESSASERALILFTSHIGGHKFAGNCIVSFGIGSPNPWKAELLSRYIRHMVLVFGMGACHRMKWKL